MTIKFDPLKSTLDLLRKGDGSISISLAAFDGSAPEYQALSTTKKVIAAFRDIIIKFLDKYDNMHQHGDLRLVPYSGGFKPDPHQVQYVKINGSHFESVVTSVPEPGDTKQYISKDVKFLKRMQFYVLIFKFGTKRVLIFKRYTKSKELSHGGGFLISLVGESYDKVSDSVFSFDEHFDCIAVDDTLFVFNKLNTEQIFRYYDQLKVNAFSTIDKIAQYIPIANLELFKTDCGTHLHKLEKLKNIAGKVYLPALNMDRIKQIIKKFDLNVKVVVVDGKEMLEHDPKDKWALLNLLDDDYLSSDLTGNNYEVNSKLVLMGQPAQEQKVTILQKKQA